MFSGDILAGFLSYITSNPPIYGLMYIPLNAVIVALIYQDSYDTDTPFPTTMTQLFDALTRALIRRHLVSTHQVPSEYCMPPSLQRTEDIGKLPPLVAQQLLQLARVAYESLYRKWCVFNDFGEDFEHLGMMKKTTSLNVCKGPECSYSFLHLTLQEYLTALHIAIANPSGFELVEWLEDSVIVRFLAGIFRHDDYHSHPVYQELVQELSSNFHGKERIQLVHCAYECPSIMQREHGKIFVEPKVDFDWYATGFCISHFDKRWELEISGINVRQEGINLLVEGLRSTPIAEGRIKLLSIESLSISQVITSLREFCRLDSLRLFNVIYDRDNDKVILQHLAPGSGLLKLEYYYSRTLIDLPLFFQQSSLQELTLFNISCVMKASEPFPSRNANLKNLTISNDFLDPLAAFILNIISLTFMKIISPLDSGLPVLASIVQSHRTLRVLHIGQIRYPDNAETTNLMKLVEAAGNSKFELKLLRLARSNYDVLPLHFQEHYSHLLQPY